MASYACREHNVTDCLVCANTALRTRLAEVEKERDAALSYLISCPWCGEQMEKRPISYQIPHLIRHGDERQSRVTALEEALRIALRQWEGYVSDNRNEDLGDERHAEARMYRDCRAALTPAAPKEQPQAPVVSTWGFSETLPVLPKKEQP